MLGKEAPDILGMDMAGVSEITRPLGLIAIYRQVSNISRTKS